jgi:excisionase family DNA binding protein
MLLIKCPIGNDLSTITEERVMAVRQQQEVEPLLTPAEVAALFRVDPKTVTRWANSGKLTSIRTLGGHRRYLESEVRALLESIPAPRTAADSDLPRG